MPTRVLFVPVSGGAGSGEVQRCLLLAQALRAPAADRGTHAPEAHFALATGTPDPGMPTRWLSASPTRVPGEVAAAIRALQPGVVVFDGNARVESLRAARAAGARCVLLSSRPSARRRGLRGRRMALLDEHWFVGVDLLDAPGWPERWARWRHPRVAVRRFATLFAEPVPAAALREQYGLPPGAPYAVACMGGGRHVLAGTGDASRLFGEAATALAAHGLPTVAVACDARPPAHSLAHLPNAELMGLLAGARVALLAGGSLLTQALALGVPVLALPLQDEQAARVRWLGARGAVQVATTRSPDVLADALHALADDDAARAALRAHARALGLRNGLDAATAALAALAGRADAAYS